MTIYTNTPYTYRIGWAQTGMNYYGVRYAKNCRPSDLFVSYFTSSKHVKNYIKQHGIPDIIEIRKIFTSETRIVDAQTYEHRVLKKLKASARPDYLNRTDNKSIAPEYRGKAPFDLTIYEFSHNSGIVERCTRHELMRKYDISASGICSLITGNRNRIKGWRLPSSLSDEELAKNRKITLSNIRMLNSLPERRDARIKGQNKPETKAKRSGSNNSAYNSTIYNFVHISGITERCTKYELRMKYNLNRTSVNSMISRPEGKCGGWALVKG